MHRNPIGVIVRMPTTEEGIARYKRRMMEVNSDILGDALNHIDAPLEAKRAYLRTLNGRAPWAKKPKDAQ